MAETTHSLRTLDSFGDVAAEDDAVLDYFLTTDAVRRISENKVVLVLGRKGSGKTALVRHFSEGQSATVSRSLSLRGYPWNLHANRKDIGASDIEAYVTSWKYLIAAEFASLLLTQLDAEYPEANAMAKFLKDNYGGVDPDLNEILTPTKLRLSKASFEPQVLGVKLGSVSLERNPGDFGLGKELNALSDAILNAIKAVATKANLPPVMLHFDELDQGLSEFDERRKLMIVGLVLAARAVRREFASLPSVIAPIVYLRSDLWDELEFSDKNKISQTQALELEWDSDSLRALVDTRIRAKLGAGADWDHVVTPKLMRGSQTKWNHILARTFLRPRDVIKFLNAALAQTKKREDEPLVFDNHEIVAARDQYSPYLKEELDDEILAHWKNWEEALQACSAIGSLTFDRRQFVTEYAKRKSSTNPVSADEALKSLYRFSVVGYERRSGYGGSSWAFQYVDPEAGWDAQAARFKVHLGLKEYAKLREERN